MIAMSGGIDSSTAAALLIEQGFDVCGITMDLFGNGPSTAANDAKAVCDALSIPHYTVDAVDIFERIVIGDFIDKYKSGRTPNPCVVCNRHLKFGLLMDKAAEHGCDGMATGHYAVIDNGQLKRGIDANKDQSYFLYPVLAAPMDKILFPLGRLTKNEVREIAKKLKLPAADKNESQDICFIPSGNYLDFLRSRDIGAGDENGAVGQIVDINGNILGTHTGIHNFTIGQRKGLGALGKRMYVKRIDVSNNTIVAAEEHQLESDEITICDTVISKARININKQYAVQIRYRGIPSEAMITRVDGSTITIKFNTPIKAAAPGQSAVIYDDDTVVAGGIIC
jgi:tRNA-specific 2-thiouridylase